jgi:hypothetical protein
MRVRVEYGSIIVQVVTEEICSLSKDFGIILIIWIEILLQALLKLKDFIPFSFIEGCFQHRSPNSRE